jgi:hypothetical protein
MIEQAMSAIQPPITAKPNTTRPTDKKIVEVLTLHFRVHESKVIEWLTDLDFDALTDTLMEAM